MKIYKAMYRFRENGALKTTIAEFEAASLALAKRIAKNLEGQDNKTWLIEVRA